jgi:hypothetical protein
VSPLGTLVPLNRARFTSSSVKSAVPAARTPRATLPRPKTLVSPEKALGLSRTKSSPRSARRKIMSHCRTVEPDSRREV